jgi:hypothetical protein
MSDSNKIINVCFYFLNSNVWSEVIAHRIMNQEPQVHFIEFGSSRIFLPFQGIYIDCDYFCDKIVFFKKLFFFVLN